MTNTQVHVNGEHRFEAKAHFSTPFMRCGSGQGVRNESGDGGRGTAIYYRPDVDWLYVEIEHFSNIALYGHVHAIGPFRRERRVPAGFFRELFGTRPTRRWVRFTSGSLLQCELWKGALGRSLSGFFGESPVEDNSLESERAVRCRVGASFGTNFGLQQEISKCLIILVRFKK